MKKLSEKDKTLHRQFSRYGRNAREWTRKCALLLPEIERNRVWEKKGFFSIYEYAAKLAGMGHDAVNDSLRILKKIEDKPELMKIVEEKGLAFARPIATIATKETAGFWAGKAKIMSKNTFETYVREIKKLEKNAKQNGLSGEAKTFNFPQQEAVTILIEPQVAEQLRKLKGQGEWNDLMKEFLKLREEKLNAELKEIEQKETKKVIKKKNKMVVAAEQNGNNGETEISKNDLYKAENHQPSSKIKKYVLHKTNHTCAFPGCTKPAEHLHHTERFGITGRHNPEKIIPLCKEHHELAHDGLIENEDAAPSEWRVRRDTDFAYINDIKFLIDQRVAEYRRL